MSGSIHDWSTTPGSNDAADAAINWAEFMAPDQVNDSARQMMARIAEYIADTTPKRASTGVANTYAVTISSTPAALTDGLPAVFVAHQSNTGASTLAVNSLGAVALRSVSGSALRNGEIQSGQTVIAFYKSSTNEFLIANGAPQLYALYSSVLSANVFGLSVGDVKLSLASSPDAGFVRLTDSVQNLVKADYPDLHTWVAAQSYPWGSASTTFGIPAAGGYFLRFGASGSSIDAGGPRTPGTAQAQSLKSHTHTGTTVSDGAHTHTVGTVTGISVGGGSTQMMNNTGSGGTTTSSNGAHTHTITTDSTGDGTENRPINVTMYADMLAKPALVASGLIGAVGFAYQFSTGTSGDPGSGYYGYDHATVSSATTIRISKTDYNGRSIGPILAALTAGTGLIQTKVGTPATYAYCKLASTPTDNTTYYTFTITGPQSAGTISNGDRFNLVISGLAGLSYGGTSTTSLAIPDTSGGAQSVTITTQGALAYQVGSLVRIASTAGGETDTHWFYGTITAYNITTGSMTISATDNRGAGATRAAWSVNIAGQSGDVTPEATALASAAAASASAASTSASAAATSATAAASSATSASSSATSASSSASTASTQATNAASSASSASTSASNASTSATNASTSASTASTQATNASNSASAAATSATNAATSETNAAASAAAASAAAAAITGTSTTSNSIATGAKTFTTQSGKQWTTGQYLLITSDAAPSTDYMFGTVTSYSSTSLVMNITVIGGSGTHTDWTINVSGIRGLQGPAGSLDFSVLSAVTSASGDKIAIGDVSDSDNVKYDTIAGIVAAGGGYLAGGTDVAVADGGTGASTASGARTNLGLVIGTDVQAYAAALASWAGVTRSSGFDTFATTPSSANLAALLTTKTGTGLSVFDTSPTLVTPVLGVATATSVNKMAITAPATSSTLTVADGKTLTASNTLTLAGTDGSTLNVGTGGTRGALATATPGTGVASALAVNVGSAGAFVTFNGAGGTPSSITLTNGTGLPVSGITASTSTAIGVGSVELGHATDTTIARLAAGVPTVEGNVIGVYGYTTTATAAGTTTLTVSSTRYQFFTGTTTQTVVLPVTSTLALGLTFTVVNPAGEVTVQSSGGNTILVMGPGSEADFVCILTSGTTAASWQALTRYQNTPIVSKSAAYTTVLSDSGKTILHPSADTTARTFTIDSNANVPYPIGTVLTFVNQASAGVMTIAITTDTMRLSSAGTTGSRSLAANGVATAMKVTSTEWIISGSGLT